MKLAFVHASRAAVDPVTNYFNQQEPSWETTNLLDDGVMRALSSGEAATTLRCLSQMIATAREEYGAEIVMLTCSAVPRDAMAQLRDKAGIPLLKIDEPMARRAVSTGVRIGVVATFPATEATTRRLIEEAAEEAGRSVEILSTLEAEALRALLAGHAAEHDKRLLDAVSSFSDRNIDALVLAQVSMARLAPEAAKLVPAPVLNSLDTSLAAIRGML